MTEFVEIDEREAPPQYAGYADWFRKNFLKSPLHVFLSVGSISFAVFVIYSFLDWVLFGATFTGDGQENCSIYYACWPFIYARFNQFMYGFYPREEQWRINIVAVMVLLSFVWLMLKNVPYKKYVALFLVVGVPVMVVVLIYGMFGLTHVPTTQWGGLTLTLTIAFTAISLSLPLGTLLALGRRSKMPVVSILSVSFIELIRAVPLITVLFMASILLPIFLPQGMTIDKLLRALIGLTLFVSAYMAEVVRGGLQGVPSGQTEAAKSLGMSHWQITGLIVLPQALRMSIPGITNQFIAIFKDTTLVIVIGLFDLMGSINAAISDTRWTGMELEGFVFAGAIYFLFCNTMSRVGRRIEENYRVGH
ncbi:MAG: amino acid ABC transporter permease [Silicimonas sp.]|nr:amino acid ABC transporter permease [Silicimonas sp.]